MADDRATRQRSASPTWGTIFAVAAVVGPFIYLGIKVVVRREPAGSDAVWFYAIAFAGLAGLVAFWVVPRLRALARHLTDKVKDRRKRRSSEIQTAVAAGLREVGGATSSVESTRLQMAAAFFGFGRNGHDFTIVHSALSDYEGLFRQARKVTDFVVIPTDELRTVADLYALAADRGALYDGGPISLNPDEIEGGQYDVQLKGNLILVGSPKFNKATEHILDQINRMNATQIRMNLTPPDADPADQVVTIEVGGKRFEPTPDSRLGRVDRLDEDYALLVKAPNPLGETSEVFILAGCNQAAQEALGRCLVKTEVLRALYQKANGGPVFAVLKTMYTYRSQGRPRLQSAVFVFPEEVEFTTLSCRYETEEEG
ncbi:MAG: hypothetical protein KQH83_00010 [Actinobacteria bacterium]|nr:hypothetical protein [Actinomycetota bacterium]